MKVQSYVSTSLTWWRKRVLEIQEFVKDGKWEKNTTWISNMNPTDVVGMVLEYDEQHRRFERLKQQVRDLLDTVDRKPASGAVEWDGTLDDLVELTVLRRAVRIGKYGEDYKPTKQEAMENLIDIGVLNVDGERSERYK